MNEERYEIVEHSDMRYTFETSGGTKYELHFVLIPHPNNLPVYAFNIEREEVEGSHSNGNDHKVRNTVAFVFARFFESIDNAILSVFDVEDGRPECRKRLFNSWFNQLNDGSILSLQAKVDSGLGLTWATMYYHRNNMFRTILERSFNELIGLE